jgi:hypothetical protein
LFLCCSLRYRFLKFCFPLNNYQLPLCFTCLVRPNMLIGNLYSSLLFFVMYTRLSPFLWYIVHWSYCFSVSSMDFCLFVCLFVFVCLFSVCLFVCFCLFVFVCLFLWYIVHWSYCFNVSSMDFCLFVFVCLFVLCLFVCLFCFDCMFRYCFFNIVQDRFWYLVPDHSFWNVKCPVINNYSAYCFRYIVI